MPLNRRDRLAVGIRHGAVALNVEQDSAGGVPNLEPSPVARIVDVPEALAMFIRDRPACRGLGLLPAPARPAAVAAITLPVPAFGIRRHGSGDQDHGQDGP